MTTNILEVIFALLPHGLSQPLTTRDEEVSCTFLWCWAQSETIQWARWTSGVSQSGIPPSLKADQHEACPVAPLQDKLRGSGPFLMDVCAPFTKLPQAGPLAGALGREAKG